MIEVLIEKDKRTVIRYTKKLEEKGLIEKKRRFNQTNMYYLKNVTSDSDKNDSDTDIILKKPLKKTQLKEKTDHTEKLLNYIEILEIDSEKKR